jgi:hypothetical protein
MTIVSDTSPINYLTLIGLERLLPKIFGRVNCSRSRAGGTPSPGRARLRFGRCWRRSEDWLEAVSAPSVTDPILAALDPGEMESHWSRRQYESRLDTSG